MALLKLFPIYGSWKSLIEILELVDEKMLSASPEYHPSDTHPYSELQAAIYTLYAEQLKADQSSVQDGGGVTNASKYAPHEKRGARFMGFHSDAVASIIFEEDASGDPVNMSETSPEGKEGDKRGKRGKHPRQAQLRAPYRKLRSMLNESNQHIAEMFLATGRAAELDPANICAGAFAHMRKGLLNLDSKGQEKHESPGRRALAERIGTMLAEKPDKLPAPTDISQLAKALLAMDESTSEIEAKMLRMAYARSVEDLKATLNAKVKTAERAIKALGLPEEEQRQMLEKVKPKPIATAIDCTGSQIRSHPVSCLIAMLLADSNGGVPELILFSDTPHSEPIPPNTEDAHPETRLSALVAAATRQARSDDGAFGAAPEYGPASVVDWGAMLRLAASLESLSGLDLLVCSDFSEVDRFAESLEAWRSEEGEGESASKCITCWKMMRPSARKRTRPVAWDPARPQVDVCFVMDTTGSMGQWIEYAKEQVQSVIQSLSMNAGMPVSVSMVSYKDFGDGGHLETHSWENAEDEAGMQRMTDFIGTLEASGGGDEPEDVAGGLDRAKSLFAEREAPSIKMTVLIADAPCHGIPDYSGDRYVTHNGTNQLTRLQSQLRDIFVQGGAELMLARCGFSGGLDRMVEEFDKVLCGGKTFCEDFDVQGSGSTIFKEKILAALESCVAHAIAPADTVAVDFVTGTDFAVPLTVSCARFADLMEEISSAADPKETKAKKTALEQLIARCEASDYDAVRATLDGVSEGFFREYEWRKPLSKLSLGALFRAGLTVSHLTENGYPPNIVAQYEDFVRETMSKRGQ